MLNKRRNKMHGKTETIETLNKAFDEGARAFQETGEGTENPYSNNQLMFPKWQEGFNLAREEA